MRPVQVGRPIQATSEARFNWIERAFQLVERASYQDTLVPDGGTGASTAIDAMANLRGWYALAASAVQVTKTGSTAEQTLATVTIPAGSIGPNGVLRISATVSNTSSANAKTYKVKLSSTAFFTFALTLTAGDSFEVLIANRNSASSQVSGGTGVSATGAIATATADVTLTITGTLASAAETLRLESYLVELLYQP